MCTVQQRVNGALHPRLAEQHDQPPTIDSASGAPRRDEIAMNVTRSLNIRLLRHHRIPSLLGRNDSWEI